MIRERKKSTIKLCHDTKNAECHDNTKMIVTMTMAMISKKDEGVEMICQGNPIDQLKRVIVDRRRNLRNNCK